MREPGREAWGEMILGDGREIWSGGADGVDFEDSPVWRRLAYGARVLGYWGVDFAPRRGRALMVFGQGYVSLRQKIQKAVTNLVPCFLGVILNAFAEQDIGVRPEGRVG